MFDQLTMRPSETVLLWQVAGELLNQLRKWETRGQFTSAAVESAFSRFLALFAVRLPSEAVLQVSFDLRARYSLSHWDCMLLAACKESGVTTLYSEDMAAGMNYNGVAIVNPFA